MRHHNTKRKFGRTKDVRNALMRELANSLILHESIKTTEAKAKELRPYVEKLVTRARENTLANRRLLLTRLGNKEVVEKLLKEIGPSYSDRPGGYTRITKLGVRKEDASPQALIEFVK